MYTLYSAIERQIWKKYFKLSKTISFPRPWKLKPSRCYFRVPKIKFVAENGGFYSCIDFSRAIHSEPLGKRLDSTKFKRIENPKTFQMADIFQVLIFWATKHYSKMAVSNIYTCILCFYPENFDNGKCVFGARKLEEMQYSQNLPHS